MQVHASARAKPGAKAAGKATGKKKHMYLKDWDVCYCTCASPVQQSSWEHKNNWVDNWVDNCCKGFLRGLDDQVLLQRRTRCISSTR